MKRTQSKQKPEKRRTGVDSMRSYRVIGKEIILIEQKKGETMGDLYRSMGIPRSQMVSMIIRDDEKIMYINFRMFTQEPLDFITKMGVEDVTYEDLQSVCSQMSWTDTFTTKEMCEILDDGIEYKNIDVTYLRAMFPDLKESGAGYFSDMYSCRFIFHEDGYLDYYDQIESIPPCAYDRDESWFNIEPEEPADSKIIMVTAVHPDTYLSAPEEYTKMRCPQMEAGTITDEEGRSVKIDKSTIKNFTCIIADSGEACPVTLHTEAKEPKC